MLGIEGIGYVEQGGHGSSKEALLFDVLVCLTCVLKHRKLCIQCGVQAQDSLGFH